MKKVVIIGGGFSGSLAARKLERKNFKVVLIDSKDYFEFTPGVLRTLVNPEYRKRIQVLHKDYLKKSEIVIGEVKKISLDYVHVTSLNGLDKKISFDYLLICSGSRYDFPIKEKNLIFSMRENHLREYFEKLRDSKNILIIGGGVVGVELCAEIVESCKGKKKITLVHAHDSLMERNHEKAVSIASDFLKERGVNLIFNERIVKSIDGKFVTRKGREFKADIAFLCTGITPNSEFMRENFLECLNRKDQILVNSFLQVDSGKKVYEKIFSAGDVNSVAEEKTAQSSEKQALLVVKNILLMERKRKLGKYLPKVRPMVISLGKYNGIFSLRRFHFSGLIPGLLKTFIEWKTMARYKW